MIPTDLPNCRPSVRPRRPTARSEITFEATLPGASPGCTSTETRLVTLNTANDGHRPRPLSTFRWRN
jgi:hypothetical protein